MAESVIVCINCSEQGTPDSPLIMDGESPIRHKECPTPLKTKEQWALVSHRELIERIDGGLVKAIQENLKTSGIAEGYKFAIYRMDGGYDNTKKRIRIDLTEV